MADLNEELVKEAIKKAEEDVKDAAEKAEDAVENVADEAEENLENATEKAEEAVNEVVDDQVEKVEGTVEDIAEEAADTDVETDSNFDGIEDSENESEDDSEDDSDEPDGEKKKFFFFKKDKKKEEEKKEEEKKDPRDEKINELNDRLMRNLAEFENFRKRSEKEKSQMFDMGAKSVLEKMLPALDSFDLGLAALSEEDRNSALGQGMEKIYKQLLTNLENVGVKQIESVGKEFDPNLHNAVMHEDNEEFGENTVSQELQKGYMYKDTVLRYAMVKVAN